jgi:uncharacterized membrane protein YczE
LNLENKVKKIRLAPVHRTQSENTSGDKMNLGRRNKLLKRLIMTLIGVIVCSFSVGLFNISAFGVDPFQCFAQGSHLLFSKNLGYGTYYLIISSVMLIGVFIWDKHFIGVATFINMFFTGYIVDFSYRFLVSLLPSVTLIQRFIFLLVALVIMCFGSALYYTADLGVSVYDAISLILAKKRLSIRKQIIPFKWIRVANDFTCVILGTIFGKIPGIGTIITAFFMGPLITVFNKKIAEPFLYSNSKKE